MAGKVFMNRQHSSIYTSLQRSWPEPFLTLRIHSHSRPLGIMRKGYLPRKWKW